MLVNNAGIEGRGENNVDRSAPTAVTADMVREVFDTNVFGVVRVTHAFLPLLQRSPAPVVVNVSSSLGSLSLAESPESFTYFYPGVAYPASKSAVNMITVQFAKQFPSMRINAVEPGYTDTDLNGHTGTQTVEEGARIIVDDGPNRTRRPHGRLLLGPRPGALVNLFREILERTRTNPGSTAP